MAAPEPAPEPAPAPAVESPSVAAPPFSALTEPRAADDFAASPPPLPQGQDFAVDDARDLPPPPFGPGARRPRRNPAKYWTALAIGFALAVAALWAAIATFGLPRWAEEIFVIRPSDEPDLVIELPRAAQDYRVLANGTVYFAANGSIINPTDHAQRVPPIRAELRDGRGDIVYEWIITPPVAVLPAGERVSFSEARADIPRRAQNMTATWAIER